VAPLPAQQTIHCRRINGVCVIAAALFAEFFSPNNLYVLDLPSAFVPPTQVHFFDASGKFHLDPFVYNVANTPRSKTFKVYWAEDTSKMFPLHFFVHGWSYKFLGLIPMDLHLYGVDKGGLFTSLGPISWPDLFGKACQAGRVFIEYEPVWNFDQYCGWFGAGRYLRLLRRLDR